MKQKFSFKTIAVAFIALGLMLTTVTSCKDYDDDISKLKTGVEANKAAIAAIKSDLAAFKSQGLLVKEVKSITGGIQLVLSDGTTHDILNGKDGENGAAGAAGTVVTVVDGVLHIDGKATEIKAVADAGDPIKVEVKDGELYINGEATGIKKAEAGLTATVTDDEITFTLPDGSTFTLSKATASLNSLVFVPNIVNAGHEPVIYVPRYKFKYLKVQAGKPSIADLGVNPAFQNHTVSHWPDKFHVPHDAATFRTITEGSPKGPLAFYNGYEVEVDVNPTNFSHNYIESLSFESKTSRLARGNDGDGVMKVLKDESGRYKMAPRAGVPGRYVITVSGHTKNIRSAGQHTIHTGNSTEVEKVQLSAVLKTKDAEGKNVEVLSDWVTPLRKSYCVIPAIARKYEYEPERGNIDQAPVANPYIGTPSNQTNKCYIYPGDYDFMKGPREYPDQLEVSVPVRNQDGTPHVFDLRNVVKLINRPQDETVINRAARTAGCCDPVVPGVTEESCDDDAPDCLNLDALIKGYGLHYEFYPMEHKVYDGGGQSYTDQAKFVKLVDPKSGAGGAEYTEGPFQAKSLTGNGSLTAAVGRSPIFQVRLVDKEGNIFALQYIRVRFIPEKTDSFTATYEEVVFTECKPTDLGVRKVANDDNRNVWANTYNPAGPIDGRFISTYAWTQANVYEAGPFKALGGISNDLFKSNYKFNRSLTDAANQAGNTIVTDCVSGELFHVDGLVNWWVPATGEIDEYSENMNTGTALFSVYKKATCVRAGEYMVAVIFTRKTAETKYPEKVIVKVKIKVNPFNDGGFWNFTDANGKRVKGYWSANKQDDKPVAKEVAIAKGEPKFDFNMKNGGPAATITETDFRGVLPKIDLFDLFRNNYSDSSLKVDQVFLNNLQSYMAGAESYKFELDTNSNFAGNIAKYGANLTYAPELNDNTNVSVLALDFWPKDPIVYIPVKLSVTIYDQVAYDYEEGKVVGYHVVAKKCPCTIKTYNFLVAFKNPAKVIGEIVLNDIVTTDQHVDLSDLKFMITEGDAIHKNKIGATSNWKVVSQHLSTQRTFAETNSSTGFKFYGTADQDLHYFEWGDNKAFNNIFGIADPAATADAANVTVPASSTEYGKLKYVTWLNSALAHGVNNGPMFIFKLRKTANVVDYPVAVKAEKRDSWVPYNELPAAGTADLKPTFIYYGTQNGHGALTQDQVFYIDVMGKYGTGDEITANINAATPETKATAQYYYGEIKVTIKASEK